MQQALNFTVLAGSCVFVTKCVCGGVRFACKSSTGFRTQKSLPQKAAAHWQAYIHLYASHCLHMLVEAHADVTHAYDCMHHIVRLVADVADVAMLNADL